MTGIPSIPQLTGVIPPMITPFADDDSIDRQKLRAEAEFLLRAGVNGIVVGGSTGEGASLSSGELYEAISVVVEAVGAKLPVLGGVIADSSEEAVRLGMAARRAGAAGLLVPPPHFHFIVAAEILAEYYRAIAGGAELPLIIYNVIPWAQVAIDAVDRLATENPAIVGVKQSGGNIQALAHMIACLKGRIRIYSAIDDLVYPSLMFGADGTISGTASVFPSEIVEMYRCVQSGDLARALELHNALLLPWRTLEGPQFPSHVKYALSLLGRCAGRPRRPLTWPQEADAARIEKALVAGGFLRQQNGRTGPVGGNDGCLAGSHSWRSAC